MKPCSVILKSGQYRGMTCGRPALRGGACGIHRQKGGASNDQDYQNHDANHDEDRRYYDNYKNYDEDGGDVTLEYHYEDGNIDIDEYDALKAHDNNENYLQKAIDDGIAFAVSIYNDIKVNKEEDIDNFRLIVWSDTYGEGDDDDEYTDDKLINVIASRYPRLVIKVNNGKDNLIHKSASRQVQNANEKTYNEILKLLKF
jgi:hypothetical protein